MVKKTRIKYLFKAIRKTGVSFFAVGLIAATSIAIYLGIQAGGVTILQHTDAYYREHRLATMEISCANGITEEDVSALSALSEVDVAEGGYRTTVLMEGERENVLVQVRSLLTALNQAEIVSGTLPAAADEIAIEEKMADTLGYAVGDVLRVAHGGELYHNTFRITAIINEPSYTCADLQDARGKGEAGFGSASYYVEVAAAAFDAAYYGSSYSHVYLENDALASEYYFADTYDEAEAPLLQILEDFGAERAALRYDALKAEVDAAILDAENAIALAVRMGAAESDVAEARLALERAREEAAEVEPKDWVVSGRNGMGDVSGVETIVEGLFTLSYSFALIFLLVAVVVCYAAVVKMIDDQKMQIGAQKALGFTSREIFVHYLCYNLLSGILGLILGFVASVVIVENLVLYVFGAEFTFDKIPLTFVWKEAGGVAVLCLAIFVAATFAGCLKVVRQSAVELLRGEMPTQKRAYFFESWGVYRKMRLYSRTMVKNLLSDRGRILTTIMGVVGCMALLNITFTLKFSISNATDVQFERYFLYENRLAIDTETGDAAAYETVLQEAGISYRRVQDKLKYYQTADGEWETVHIVALSPDVSYDGFLCLTDVEDGSALSLPADGVLVSQKCAENNDLSVGAAIALMDADGVARECRVAGVMEHYLPYHQIVMSAEYYESVLGETADACIFLLCGDVGDLYETVHGMDGFISLKDNSEYKNPFTSINLVIAICVFFSAIMAVLVLLNQMTMYINRKSRELSVMRINGYTVRETEKFVSRDNIFLVVIGLLFGSLIGTPLAQLEVCIMETGPSRYIRTPNWSACLLSALVCILFALVINRIALRKIRTLSLTNVNGN